MEHVSRHKLERSVTAWWLSSYPDFACNNEYKGVYVSVVVLLDVVNSSLLL